jgi:hypothetical protein
MGDFLFDMLNSFMYLYDMEVKLYKVLEHYHLYGGDKAIATTIVGNPMLLPNLSLKNCQEIERGYDLDELVLDYEKENEEHIQVDERQRQSFKAGFQKSLEVNDDKRFTLEDMMNCWNKALKFQDHKETLGEHIQSLQRTEWDVEVEMICPHPMDTYRCGLQYGCDGDGCNHPNQVPYLDRDGCLILKRK